MIVLIHVFLAVSSLLYTSYLCIRPKSAKFYISYSGFVGTLVSGTYLVIHSHAQLLSACVSGLTYLALASFVTVLAHRAQLQDQAD